jgi:hypothetical protein
MPRQPICDICDGVIFSPHDHMTLSVFGVEEKIHCHSICATNFYKCKGDYSKLPDGRFKHSYYRAEVKEGEVTKVLENYITRKMVYYIMEGLKISKEEGDKRINGLAIDFFALPKLGSDEKYSLVLQNRAAKLVIRRVQSMLH